MPNVLFAGAAEDWPEYGPALKAELSARGIPARVARDIPPAEVDYVVFAPDGPVSDFSPFTRAKAVLSLWAGVESVVNNPTLTQPLARMADTGLREGMTEWVTAHVLRHHLGLDTHIHGQDGVWRLKSGGPPARKRPVGILGLGALGQACGQALSGLGFPVMGWSRSAKQIAGIECLSGEEGLQDILQRAQILVLLLPKTAATQNIINAEALAQMPIGAFLINPGRGPLIDDDALLAALDEGRIAHATLDVFRVEPLPAEHPFWSHPKVTVTPHIAAATLPETAAEFVAENIARVEAGQSLLAEVDRSAGY